MGLYAAGRRGRMALGGDRGAIVRLMVRPGLRLVLAWGC